MLRPVDPDNQARLRCGRALARESCEEVVVRSRGPTRGAVAMMWRLEIQTKVNDKPS
eukprot:COSAG05_NODE_381_length_10519_cov_17.942131_8_plen_57_part_00